MLNVQDHYTYKTKSSDKVNNVAIHPLSNRSLNEYISNISHANKFLDKTKLIKPKNFITENFTENDAENNERNYNNNNNKKNNRNASNIFFTNNDENNNNNNKNSYKNDFEKQENKNFLSTQYLNKKEAPENRNKLLNQLNEDKSFVKLVGRYNTSNNSKNLNKLSFSGLGKETGFNQAIGNVNSDCDNNNSKNFKASSLLQLRKSMNHADKNKFIDKGI